MHPDPTAEAVRWQICEGELVQAIGRARGVNRTADNPLAIDIIADVCLPVTVDEIVPWAQVPTGAEVEMIVAGIWLDSPSDMAKAWPKVWQTEEAAHGWRKRFTGGQSPIENILYRRLTACGRYQLPGPRQKWRAFRYAPDVVSDPQAWLEARVEETERKTKKTAHPNSLANLRPIRPGQALNPSGRPKMPAEVREAAMALTPDAIRTLGEVMLNPLVPPGVRVTAAEKILDRALGKPAQTVDVTNRKDDALDYSIAELVAIAYRRGLEGGRRGGRGGWGKCWGTDDR